MAKNRDTFGVYTVDPGGKTGTAKGVFLKKQTLVETFRAHTVEADEWLGDPIVQASNIAKDYLNFRELCVLTGISRIDLIVETFRLRQMAVDLSPVEVTAALRANLLGLDLPDLTGYQTASEAKSFATATRLKRWGLYRVGRGSDHKRDALRHLALRVSVIIDER